MVRRYRHVRRCSKVCTTSSQKKNLKKILPQMYSKSCVLYINWRGLDPGSGCLHEAANSWDKCPRPSRDFWKSPLSSSLKSDMYVFCMKICTPQALAFISSGGEKEICFPAEFDWEISFEFYLCLLSCIFHSFANRSLSPSYCASTDCS